MKTEYFFRAPSAPGNYFEVQMTLALCALLAKHSRARWDLRLGVMNRCAVCFLRSTAVSGSAAPCGLREGLGADRGVEGVLSGGGARVRRPGSGDSRRRR